MKYVQLWHIHHIHSKSEFPKFPETANYFAFFAKKQAEKAETIRYQVQPFLPFFTYSVIVLYWSFKKSTFMSYFVKYMLSCQQILKNFMIHALLIQILSSRFFRQLFHYFMLWHDRNARSRWELRARLTKRCSCLQKRFSPFQNLFHEKKPNVHVIKIQQ